MTGNVVSALTLPVIRPAFACDGKRFFRENNLVQKNEAPARFRVKAGAEMLETIVPRENTPGRGRKSTGRNKTFSAPKDAVTEAEALREEYLGLFDDLIAEALAFQNTSGSSSAEDEIVRRIKQWQDTAKSLTNEFVQQLCEIYANSLWVRLEAEKAWPLFTGKYLFVIGVILQLARAWANGDETERQLADRRQRLRNMHKKIIRRAQYLALTRARRRLEGNKPDPLTATKAAKLDHDPFKNRIGELMRRFPHWSNERIIGKCVDEGGEVPARWKKHNHSEGDMLDVFRCPKCRHPLDAQIARIRRRLELPQRR